MANRPLEWAFPAAYWSCFPDGSQYPMIFEPTNQVWSSAYYPYYQAMVQPQHLQSEPSYLAKEEDNIGGNNIQWSEPDDKVLCVTQKGDAMKVEDRSVDGLSLSTKEQSSHSPNRVLPCKTEGFLLLPLCSVKHQNAMKYRMSLDSRYHPLIDVLESPSASLPFSEVIEGYKEQLKEDMERNLTQVTCEAQLDIARKNVTQSYIQLFRFALKLMAMEESADSHCISQTKLVLSKKLPTIQTVIQIYRSSELVPFVAFLKQYILTEQQLPQLVMALDVKPSDKLIMMLAMPGFLYALHHPNESYGSWNLETHRTSGNTVHIAQAIKEQNIGYSEVMVMLQATYKTLLTGKKSDFKYNNISGRYRTIIQRAIAELYRQGKVDLVETARLEDILKSGGKASSIECLRNVLFSQELRDYLQEKFIDNGRLMLQILNDGSLKCHTKLTMMKCYPAFVQAVAQPDEFYSWRG